MPSGLHPGPIQNGGEESVPACRTETTIHWLTTTVHVPAHKPTIVASTCKNFPFHKSVHSVRRGYGLFSWRSSAWWPGWQPTLTSSIHGVRTGCAAAGRTPHCRPSFVLGRGGCSCLRGGAPCRTSRAHSLCALVGQHLACAWHRSSPWRWTSRLCVGVTHTLADGSLGCIALVTIRVQSQLDETCVRMLACVYCSKCCREGASPKACSITLTVCAGWCT